MGRKVLPSGDLWRARRISLARGRGGVAGRWWFSTLSALLGVSKSNDFDFTMFSLTPTGRGGVPAVGPPPLGGGGGGATLAGLEAEDTAPPLCFGRRGLTPPGLDEEGEEVAPGSDREEATLSGLGETGLGSGSSLGLGETAPSLGDAAPPPPGLGGTAPPGLADAATRGLGDTGRCLGEKSRGETAPLRPGDTAAPGLGETAPLAFGMKMGPGGVLFPLLPLLLLGSAWGFLLRGAGLPSSLTPDESLPERCSKWRTLVNTALLFRGDLGGTWAWSSESELPGLVGGSGLCLPVATASPCVHVEAFSYEC